jgi:magnesium-transporting ATPase (P-type)
MTGESDEMKKDSLDKCLRKREEKLQELEATKGKTTSHSLSSPIMLSGTQVTTGEGWFVATVVGDNSAIG